MLNETVYSMNVVQLATHTKFMGEKTKIQYPQNTLLGRGKKFKFN